MQLSTPLLFAFGIACSFRAGAQPAATEQNPRYLIGQAKYELMADSVNRQHGTTLQNTYTAYDWYDSKRQRRTDRTLFRRELRLERARYNYGWGYQPYDTRWHNNYNSYWNRSNRYNNSRHNRNRSVNPFFFFNGWCW